ncbi:MAG: radical SAM family heme chaperone HemW [Aestuariivirgaceae bacterium]|nr:radical SAM family heme chaperone HemW [Aestuariivirgaceae bacterium]
MNESHPGFGVYVHWPFCKAKCPYCDFNSHVRHGGVDAMDFAKGLAAELKHMRGLSGPRSLDSVFFGGGTPSLMPPQAVDHVLRTIDELWGLGDLAEVTLEANPTSIEAENFKGYRAAGVNRVSVGVQALHDADLAKLGRQHSVEEALTAFRLARDIFPRVSFDLIYARPGQTLAAWEAELARALKEAAGHMSLYQLTIEPGTAYHDLHHAGKLVIPDDDHAASLYELTQEMTQSAGLRAYEVSNHALPGQESRHNLIYWRYGDYAGAGPGAHGRIATPQTKLALSTLKDPEGWRRAVAEHGNAITERTELSGPDQGFEYLIMGLRLSQGISLARYANLNGEPIPEQRLATLVDEGMLIRHDDNVAATPAGRRVLNALIARLAGI